MSSRTDWDWLAAPPAGNGSPPIPVYAPAPAPVDANPAPPVGESLCVYPLEEDVDPFERARELLDYGP
jgi:hypothetical protein